jgi:ribonuclease J
MTDNPTPNFKSRGPRRPRRMHQGPPRAGGVPGGNGPRPPRRERRPSLKPGEHSPTAPRGEEGEEQVVSKRIPPIAPGTIRIIPLGGVEEIGKNMTAIEFGDDIIVVDAGLAFPGDEAPGVDYIIPDTTYLEENKSKIRGLVVTHGHLDHIGGIPYIMPKIGNPPIYTTELTGVMIKKRQEEFPYLPKLDIQIVDRKDKIKLGNLAVRFFAATHTIPDAMGVIVETPFGNVIFTGDIKINHVGGEPEPEEVETFGKLGKENNLLIIADSTNVEKPGFSYAEKEVHENLRKIISEVKGRVLVGTFASLFERIVYIVEASEAMGKKIVVEGRAMKTNIEIAKELGILKVKKDTIISSENMDDFPDNKIVILATGAQGDEFAALMRIAQKEHRFVKLKKGDTVLLSSSVIPGNEKAVQKLKDNLARLGAKIVHYGVANVHSSGHSYQGEIEWIHKMVKARYLVPVHGHHSMLRVHADVAMNLGMPEKNIIVPDNGMVIEISEEGKKFSALKEAASSRLVMVDGLGSNNVQEVVIRDRQMLSQDGMFVIIAIIDMQTGKVRKSPDIISRGFVYLKENQDLLRQVRLLAKKKIEDASGQMHPINFDYLKNIVREELGKYLFQKTHKRPIILPVLIEV